MQPDFRGGLKKKRMTLLCFCARGQQGRMLITTWRCPSPATECAALSPPPPLMLTLSNCVKHHVSLHSVTTETKLLSSIVSSYLGSSKSGIADQALKPFSFISVESLLVPSFHQPIVKVNRPSYSRKPTFLYSVSSHAASLPVYVTHV